MPEILEKLRPDRDLQCYFERPSAIAAMSGATPSGFTLSGCFRQQFDWAVVEWNRDNVIEHPALRNLPDGDLSGMVLSYEETRNNCIPIDSDLYPTVDWNTLRVWAGAQGSEEIYYVDLRSRAEAVEGTYQCASAEFTLQGTAVGGDVIGLEFLGQHHTYQLYASDTLESAAQAIVDSINAFSPMVTAERAGTTIRLLYTGRTAANTKASPAESTKGANGNRVGAYSYHSAGASARWSHAWRMFSGGVSPSRWRVTIDFRNLTDNRNPARVVPTHLVRKLRWTYAADLQAGDFQRREFEVSITNWQVTGTGRSYSVAGPGSKRIEDGDPEVTYGGSWDQGSGNFSSGTIHWTQTPGAYVEAGYTATATHRLYLGTRYIPGGSTLAVELDGQTTIEIRTHIPGEDVLGRIEIGVLGPGQHSVRVTQAGHPGEPFYFDFLEVAVPAEGLPEVAGHAQLTAATDWDTDHSLALPAERTAWLLRKLGFRGRANHYVGALWFYELVRNGHEYASGAIAFSGIPTPNSITTLTINGAGAGPQSETVIHHLHHIGDTPETLARAFALELNRGYTAIHASVDGSSLEIRSRAMGADGNQVAVSCSTNDPALTIETSGSSLSGGVDGTWIVDMMAPTLTNRAARDWSRAYYAALAGYGVGVTAAYSMELQHGDTSATSAIAQRGPLGEVIWLPTPALQTNFSSASLAFWKTVHAEMAQVMTEAGVTPYLQFGEVQWWYFNNNGLGLHYSGMPYYDEETKANFQAEYGRPMPVLTDHFTDPAAHPEEAVFLARRIGRFCDAIVQHVRGLYPNCKFEVLYPTDVNQTAWNRTVNYPAESWTPEQLECIKTEGFGFTYNRDVEGALHAADLITGFPPARRAHLVGIGDPHSSWVREVKRALDRGYESVVLWALDQFCLIGYALPAIRGRRRSARMGS